jgi:hypothetical protein
VPLIGTGSLGDFRKFGVAAGDEGQVVQVLGDGVVVEGPAVVLQVAESSGDAGRLAWWQGYKTFIYLYTNFTGIFSYIL